MIVFWDFMLVGANCTIKSRVILIETINQTLAHPREVLSPAIKIKVISIIIVHNHLSGILEPLAR